MEYYLLTEKPNGSSVVTGYPLNSTEFADLIERTYGSFDDWLADNEEPMLEDLCNDAIARCYAAYLGDAEDKYCQITHLDRHAWEVLADAAPVFGGGLCAEDVRPLWVGLPGRILDAFEVVGDPCRKCGKSWVYDAAVVDGKLTAICRECEDLYIKQSWKASSRCQLLKTSGGECGADATITVRFKDSDENQVICATCASECEDLLEQSWKA